MRSHFTYARVGIILYWAIGILIWVITFLVFMYLEVKAVESVQALANLGYAVNSDHYVTAMLIPFVPAFGGFMFGLGSLVLSDFLKIMVGIEENTRAAQLVMRQRKDGRLRPVNEYPVAPQSVWDDPARKVLPRIDQQPVAPRSTRHQRG